MKPKTSPLFAALVGSALLIHTSSAQDGDRPRPPGGPEGRNPAEMLKRADTDGDGKVNKAEFVKSRSTELEEVFGRIDANADGFIDDAEVTQMGERMRAQGGPPGPGRGAPEGMRRPEGEGRPEGMRRPEGEGGFRRPPEGEGRPDGAGRPEGPGRPDGAARPEGAPGADRGAMMDQAFGRMDQNADGQLSKEEFTQGMGRMREMMQRGGMSRGPEGQGRGPGGPGGEGGFRRPPQQGGEGAGKPRPELEGEAKGKPEAPAKKDEA